jgi:hypothetical protein
MMSCSRSSLSISQVVLIDSPILLPLSRKFRNGCIECFWRDRCIRAEKRLDGVTQALALPVCAPDSQSCADFMRRHDNAINNDNSKGLRNVVGRVNTPTKYDLNALISFPRSPSHTHSVKGEEAAHPTKGFLVKFAAHTYTQLG